MSFKRHVMKSPVGRLILVENEGHLEGVIYERKWPLFRKRFQDHETTRTPLLKEAEKQLRDYFSGKRQTFDLPLRLEGTDFQKKVWSALKRIPFGKTRTYKEQAIFAQSPKAVRAVGQTNGLNSLCIVLPCHRVIGSNGQLTGYGGGLPAKKYLLRLEGIVNGN